jgi:NAD(P)-dependent dehydrogenase (short-subunit alcohol dehydrogenase family)
MASEGHGRLAGKVALITGASKGIGKAIALAYAREGASVCICARRERDLNLAAEEIRAAGGQVFSAAGDIGNAADVGRIVQSVQQKFGIIDVLVNNASLLGPRVTIAEYPIADWEDVIRVNLTGPFLIIRETLKIMNAQRSGSIINLSSGVGRNGRARWGAYAVSKFGVEGLTQVLADEVAALNIRVNSVNPGPTRTEMRALAYPDEDPRTLPTPDEIVGIFVYLASDESSQITGKALEARDWLNEKGIERDFNKRRKQ